MLYTVGDYRERVQKVGDYREGGYALIDYRVCGFKVSDFRERKKGKGKWSGYHKYVGDYGQGKPIGDR